MKLDEIKALTPDVIATLPAERIEELTGLVQMVDCLREPTPDELDHIRGRVRETLHSLESERLARSMRLCGGLREPYLTIRLPGTLEAKVVDWSDGLT